MQEKLVVAENKVLYSVSTSNGFLLGVVCFLVCLFVCLFLCFLPLQVFPSPVNPALQLQEYEPTVFTQSEFTSQL